MFKLIRNMGSPTRWDITAYMDWLKANPGALSADLMDAVSEDRYSLDGDRSLWHAELHQMAWGRCGGRIQFRSDSGTHFSEFVYTGVRKVHVEGRRFRAAPSLVTHEVLPFRNGYIRHAMSFLGGDFLVIYANHVAFNDVHDEACRRSWQRETFIDPLEANEWIA